MKRAPCFLYRTRTIEVCSEALPAVMTALAEVAEHAYRHEIGTRLCAFFQDRSNTTHILGVAVFDDEYAERVHEASGPARRLAQLLENGLARSGAAREWGVVAGI
jgi:hypothetical protein